MNDQQHTPVSGQETKPKARLSRKFRLGTVATVTTIVVIAAILLLNVVMDAVEARYPLTLDLTAEGTYTLSEKSVTLAKGIEKDVEIIVFRNESFFASPNQAELLNTVLTQFYQTLKSYQMESGGKVSYQFIDLDANPTLAARYEEYDVNSKSVLFLCEDRFQLISLEDLYAAKDNYTTYEITYTSEVERVVAAKINLVTAQNSKTATILMGHGEDAGAITGLTKMLNNNACEVETLDITASAEPVEENSVFIIPAPSKDYTVEEVAKLRKWLDNDGKREKDLVVFLNSSARLPNLYELLADQYKIEVLEQIVVETDLKNVFAQEMFYTYATVQSTEYTAALANQRALLAFAAPMKLTGSTSTEESLYTQALATHSEIAKVQPLEARLEQGTDFSEIEDMQDADSYPLVTAAYTVDRMFDNDTDQYYTTNVMVFGSPTMVYEATLNLTSACNEDLFLNTFRGLTGLESVISISSRSLDYELLDFGGSQTPIVLAVIFMAVLPLMIVAVSIVVFVRRRRL